MEDYAKNGAADLISKEELIASLKEADEAEDEAKVDVCENCSNGEPCNKDQKKIHCNVWDKSYLKNHTCDEYK